MSSKAAPAASAAAHSSELKVANEFVPYIIGKGGENIKRIRADCPGVNIDIPPKGSDPHAGNYFVCLLFFVKLINSNFFFKKKKKQKTQTK